MSADNTIVILESPGKSGKEYRVAHVTCWDEVHWNEKTSKHDLTYVNKQVIYECFTDCEVFRDKAEAEKQAEVMFLNCYYVEYGIQEFEINFPVID